VPAFRAGGGNAGDAQYTCRFCRFALLIDSLLMVLVRLIGHLKEGHYNMAFYNALPTSNLMRPEGFADKFAEGIGSLL
jgi:hypothetical protein